MTDLVVNNANVLVVHNLDNYGICDAIRNYNKYRGAENCFDATIWGGVCSNCAESEVSRLVSSQRENLIRFIYLPSRHKGGRMVRPHYGKGSDRRSTMEFPSLEILGYYEDRGSPAQVLWIVPKLKSLYVFGNSVHNMLERWNVSTTATTRVTGGETPNGANDGHPLLLAWQVLDQCPSLQEIICATPDFKTPSKFHKHRRLLPPRTIPWNKLRLLEIVLQKEQAINADNSKSDCPMAALPRHVVNHIVSFCHCEHWQVTDFPAATTNTTDE
jgi:hypothetical protein